MPNKLALLVDCGFGSLKASAVSAGRVSACLERHGFTSHLLRGAEATREAIQAFLHTGPAAALGSGDAFVFYFVGHGERVRDPAYGRRELVEAPTIADVLLLITHDVLFEQRQGLVGLSGIELAEGLRPIAEATDNVTVLLDCCHAAGIVACDGAADPLPVDALDRVSARIHEAYKKHRPVTRSAVTARERRIVRLVATIQDENAIEGPGSCGEPLIGLFSDAVAAALSREGAESIPWSEHLLDIQRSVLARCPIQRPGLEGPRLRYPFDIAGEEPGGPFACEPNHGRVTLFAGSLCGLEIGDVFRIILPAGSTATLELPLAELEPTRAILGLARPGAARSSIRCRQAVLVRRARELAVAVQGGAAEPLKALRAALRDDDGLALVDRDPAAIATLTLGDDASELREVGGDLVHRDGPPGAPPVRRRLLAALRRFVAWHRLDGSVRRLVAHSDPPVVECMWGLAGSDEPLPDAGAVLRPGDAVWFRLRSLSDPRLHVSVFHVRGDRSVHHLDRDCDHGLLILRNRVTDLTHTAAGVSRPWPIVAPPLPLPVRERFLLVISAEPVSLHRVAEPTRSDERLTYRGSRTRLIVLTREYRLEPGA